MRWAAPLLLLLAGVATAQPDTSVRLTGNVSFTPVPGESGLLRGLRAEVEVDVQQPGFYWLDAHLERGGTQVAIDPPGLMAIPNAVHLSADTAGLHRGSIWFSGEQIYRSGLDGPYDLVFDAFPDAPPLRSPPYRHTDFGQITGLMVNPSARPADDDGDGRYEGLDATVTVVVRAADRFALSCELSDASGESFTNVRTEWVEFLPGVHTLTARFPSTHLHRYGQNGVFHVFLSLYSSSEMNVYGDDASAEVATMPLFAADFEPLLSVGTVAEVPIDQDADGRFEALQLSIPVEVTGPGPYTVTGTLLSAADTDGRPARVSVEVEGVGRSTETLVLRFKGRNITHQRLDGPYRLFLSAYDGREVADEFAVDSLQLSLPHTAFDPEGR